MTLVELTENLEEIGLQSKCYEDGLVAVVKPGIANPLLSFQSNQKSSDYNGYVKVKAVNVPIYSQEQLYSSLQLVNQYLLTPLEKRGI